MTMDLLKNGAIIAIFSCSLGLTACSTMPEEEIDIQPICMDETGVECVVVQNTQTAVYLPEFSNQNYQVKTSTKATEKTTRYGSRSGTDLSVSRPAGIGGVSVKEKMPTPQPVEIVPQQMKRVTTEVTTVETKTVETKPVPKEKPIEITIVREEKPAEVKVSEEPKPVEEKIPEPVMEEEKPVVTVTEPVSEETPAVQAVEQSEPVAAVQDKSLAEKVAYGKECHDWEAAPGNTLRGLLMNWGEESGWTVIWQLDRDYHLEAGVVFRGTFTEVAGALIRSFARATPAPIGTFYNGNRVLVVNTQEDENAN
ncbi:MAG: TcpQ domain-containing protein [Alphaproteobacteria bacterium]